MIVERSSYEVYTLLAALAASSISALTLWFTSLKGPDIILCEKPDFDFDRIPKETFERIIPNHLSCGSDLVFLNNGTLSGVLRLDAHFQPAEEMKPFLDRARFTFGLGDHQSSPEPMIPLSIPEKESRIIGVNLSVDFHSWKKHFSHEPVSKEEIQRVLCQADKRNQQRFSDFCVALRNSKCIGKITVKSHQTSRHRIFWTTFKERILVDSQHIEVFDQELVGNFRSWEEKWNTVDPNAVLMELRSIREILEKELYERVEQNYKMLMGLQPMGQLYTNLLDETRRRFEGYEDQTAIIHFLFGSTQLDTSLQKYDHATKEWNQKLSLSREGPPNKKLEERLNTERQTLERESVCLAAAIRNLLETLKACYLSKT